MTTVFTEPSKLDRVVAWEEDLRYSREVGIIAMGNGVVPIGMVLGAAGALYLVYRRYGKS